MTLARAARVAATAEFRILGPVEVLQDGSPVRLGGKLVRALVAALVLHAGRVRGPDQLIDDLWADAAPASARACLHNLVSQLRRTLAPGLLETRCSGYVLAVDGDQVDAGRFERLLERSRREAPAEKARTLEQALALWRGSPLLDVRYEDFAQSEIRRLEELHVSALEELLAARLELGEPEAVVPQLQKLVAEFPFRERLRMQLILSLHRSGRPVEAVAAYREWERLLEEWCDAQPGHAVHTLLDDLRDQGRGLNDVRRG